MTEDCTNSLSSTRRERLEQRVEKMRASGRLSEQEAARLRAARGPAEFDEAVRDVRVRHAGARLEAAVADGTIARDEADALLERLRSGEHSRSLRARIGALRPGRAPDTGRAAGS
jgi:predicted outer membrane protein